MILPPILRADEVAAALDDVDDFGVDQTTATLLREQFARAFEEYGPTISAARILASLCRCGTGMADVDGRQLLTARIARAYCGCLLSGTPKRDGAGSPILADDYARDPVAFTTEVVRLVLRACEAGALKAAAESAAKLMRGTMDRRFPKKEMRATVTRARKMLEIALEGEQEDARGT